MPNKKLEIVSVLLDRDVYRSRSQVKRALIQRGLTTDFGIVEGPNYWRVAQTAERMAEDSFETSRKIRGMRAVRARRKS